MVEQLLCNIKTKKTVWRYRSYFYGTNCYFVEDKKSAELLIVDPGGFTSEIFYFLEQFKEYEIIVLVTHEHFDHHISLGLLSKLFSITILVPGDGFVDAINDSRTNISHYSNYFLPAAISTQRRIMEVKNLETVYAPGHSKQSFCYIFDGICFSGDTIIDKEFMVLKLPGACKKAFENSIDLLKEKLSESTLILPGHGDPFLLKSWYLWKKL